MSQRRRKYAGGVLLAVSVLASACSSASPKEESAAPTTVAKADSGAPEGASMVEFTPTISYRWNQMSLAAVRHEISPLPPVVARSLFIVHTSMYDAWAAYEPTAEGAVTGKTLDLTGSDEDQAKAVSVAAYWAINDQFPDFDKDTKAPAALLKELVGEPNPSPAAGSPEAVGLAAAKAVTESRQNDGSNEGNGYAEPADNIYGVWKEGAVPGLSNWTPLKVPTGKVRDEKGEPVVDLSKPESFEQQEFVTPHWGQTTPFALTSGNQVRPVAPPQFGNTDPYTDAKGKQTTYDQAFKDQFNEVLELNATLTDEQKLIAEYWADGPRSETPPGHWNVFAQAVSARDDHTLDEDVKMFFALNASLFDASIAGWDTKRFYNSPRPVTAIPRLNEGVEVLAWGGPNEGTTRLDGGEWQPYQKSTFLTPGFPEYVSGHSIFSAAAAETLTRFAGKDTFFDGTTTLPWDRDGDGQEDLMGQVNFVPGSGKFERMPDRTIALQWTTFTAAASEAGFSRLYGGIHIQDGDLRGREMGRAVADVVWAKTNRLWGA